VAVARAFLGAHVDGLDADPASVADARRLALDAGLDGRVWFIEADAGGLPEHGRYDLVLILEALHDMARPLDALRAARAALVPGGAVLVVDERVADAFTAPGDEVERMMYGWSVTHCLPTQLVEEPSAALGTVMRAGTVRELAADAGFSRADVLPVENDFFRLDRLKPLGAGPPVNAALRRVRAGPALSHPDRRSRASRWRRSARMSR
jgi:SAM-dependent methyltransferase